MNLWTNSSIHRRSSASASEVIVYPRQTRNWTQLRSTICNLASFRTARHFWLLLIANIPRNSSRDV